MIRTFASVVLLMLLAGARGYAQETPATQAPASQAPATQTPAAQQPAPPAAPAQESSEEETSTSRRKAKPHDYRNWTFNVGGGANMGSGTTKIFVKGGGGAVSAGVARNYAKYFGIRLDGVWADLPLRSSALQLAQAPGASDYVYGLTLGPIINIPVTKKYAGYFLVGPGYFHHSGELDSSTFVAGSACNPFWTWWGTCRNGSVPITGNFEKTSQNEFGFTFAAGVSRKVSDRLEIYGEYRYLHAKHDDTTIGVQPITVGIRW
jgi:opacity protein-like surface antigen